MVQKFDTPIERATTPSLEALRAFSLGDSQRLKGQEPAAIPFFKHAVELDQDFALAYARLAVTHSNLGQLESSRQYAAKAFELRDRVSERERFYITARYHDSVSGDFDKVRETYELWRQTYPRDYIPQNNLGVHYVGAGQFEKGLEASQAAMKIGEHVYRNMQEQEAAAAGNAEGATAESTAGDTASDNAKDGDILDATFEEVDENKRANG